MGERRSSSTSEYCTRPCTETVIAQRQEAIGIALLAAAANIRFDLWWLGFVAQSAAHDQHIAQVPPNGWHQ